MATEIGKVNVSLGAAERIEDNGGNPTALKRELLKIKAEMDQKYYTDVFANTDVAVQGSFEAGSYTLRVKLRSDNTEERVAGAQVSAAQKIKIKEVIGFPNKERNTIPEFWLAEELNMGDAAGVASKAIGQQLQAIRNELEANTVDAMTQAAYDKYVAGEHQHYTYDYDISSKTGAEILDDIADKWDILTGGNKNWKTKQTFIQSEISTLVSERVWRKLTNTFSVMGTGSETQAKMLLSNTIPQGEMGGGMFYKVPSSILQNSSGITYPIIIGTNGLFGSIMKKRRIRIFNEAPSRRAGEIETYCTYRDMNKVVFPSTIFVFTEDATEPVRKKDSKKTNKKNK